MAERTITRRVLIFLDFVQYNKLSIIIILFRSRSLYVLDTFHKIGTYLDYLSNALNLLWRKGQSNAL